LHCHNFQDSSKIKQSRVREFCHSTRTATFAFFRNHKLAIGVTFSIIVLAILFSLVACVLYFNYITSLAKEKAEKIADLTWKEKVLELLEAIAKKTVGNVARPKRVLRSIVDVIEARAAVVPAM
jgi:hypothetical protein